MIVLVLSWLCESIMTEFLDGYLIIYLSSWAPAIGVYSLTSQKLKNNSCGELNRKDYHVWNGFYGDGCDGLLFYLSLLVIVQLISLC